MAGGVSQPSWRARAGAFLGIGASPATLVLGAGIAARNGGPPAVVTIAAGAVLMALMLYGQGSLGLARPVGEDATLGQLVPRYLPRRSGRLLNALMATAMIGWLGFNLGLGGAALSALLQLPPWLGPLLLGVPLAALSVGGMRRWNVVAVVVMTSALVLAVVVTVRLAEPAVPISFEVPRAGIAFADIAAFVGYVAVFGLRTPDFTAGLRSRADLHRCVALMVVPMVAMTLAGVAIHQGTGSSDLVGLLAAPGGLAVGNLLVAVAVIGAAFTAAYSGSLALTAVSPLSLRQATLGVVVPGIALAVMRFDRLLLPWLTILAATLPPLIVAMAIEGARRRRGLVPRTLPWFTWGPAACLAVALTLLDQPVAPIVGLAVAVVATMAATASTTPRPDAAAQACADPAGTERMM